ncbi:hypothetical protein LP417_06170 [Polaromonas sp. P1-6]|nr:hypothetical protein LP417_06170 [Polaromonas sp. P1-6]
MLTARAIRSATFDRVIGFPQRLESRGWSAPWLPMAEIFQLSTDERVEVLNPAANTVTTTMSVK